MNDCAEPAQTSQARPDRSQQPCPLAPLCDATRNLNNMLDLDQVLAMMLEQLAEAVPYDSAAVFLVEGERIRIQAWRGFPDNQAIQDMVFPLQRPTLVGEVIRQRQPLVLEDAAAHPLWVQMEGIKPAHGWIGTPLLAGGEVVGVLTVDSQRVDAYSSAEVAWVNAYADYAAVAVRNALMATRTREALARRSFLYEAARTLSATLDADEIPQMLLNLIHQHFQPDAVSVALVESDGTLAFQAASGGAADQVRGLRLPAGTGIVGWVARTGEPLWVPDVNKDPRYYHGVDQQTGFKTQSIYAMPVKIGQTTLAVLEMINPSFGLDHAEAREVMAALAALAASAIRNARLFSQARLAEERYQRLFEFNLDPVIVMDEVGRLLDLNRAARTLFQLSKKATGASCLVTLGLTPERFAELKHTLLTEASVAWEVRFTGSDGTTRTLEVHLTRLPSYTTTMAAYQWLAHDVTDRVVLEEMRSQLSNMIVHDLRNPLNNISSSFDLLKSAWEQQDTTIPVQDLIRIAERSIRRMEQLISSILDIASLSAGEKLVSPTSITVSELVVEVADILQPTLVARRLTLIRQIPDNLPMLQGDPDMLRRVITNLLDNAIKFTPAGGTIALKVTADQAVFHFIIADTGPGIPPEDRQRIFDPFVRLENHRTVKGSGLGLAFCKLAVEAHGGKIWVESQPGEGSQFIFTIPR